MARETSNAVLGMPTVPVQAPNLASDTAALVVLRAGYEQGAFGTIFQGNLVQSKLGREGDAVNTYLDIMACDGDFAVNFAIINHSLAAGYTPNDVHKEIGKAFSPYGTTPGPGLPDSVNQTPAPRGKAMFGMARDTADTLATSHELYWRVENGQLTWDDSHTASGGNKAIVLNSTTGMIGVPEQSQFGVTVRCLINPEIKTGSLLQINNADINRQFVSAQGGPVNEYLAGGKGGVGTLSTAADGLYRAVLIDTEGDTRGEEWYMTIVAQALQPGITPLAVPDSAYYP